jgi:hypothetical protein
VRQTNLRARVLALFALTAVASLKLNVTAGVVGPVSDDGTPAGVYTGETMFWTTSPTSNTAPLTLAATIQDISSDCAGDITKGRITFATRNADGIGHAGAGSGGDAS